MLIPGEDIPGFPYSIGWFVTNACNYKCIHCNMSSGKMLYDELTTKEALSLVESLAKNGTHSIFFTGGEPFFRSDFVQIAEEALHQGIHVHVTTNGSCLSEDMIKRHLVKYSSVRVSLDSTIAEKHDQWRQTKGAYNVAVKVIRLLVEYRVDVSVSMCVSRWNVSELLDMLRLLESFGVRQLTIPLFSPDGRGRGMPDFALSPLEVRTLLENLRLLRQEHASVSVRTDIPYSVLMPDPLVPPRNYPCSAAKTEMTIFANGDISPCFALPVKCGNVRTSDIENVWTTNSIFHMFRDPSLVKGKCAQCDHLSICGGGCRAISYVKTGSYFAEDTSCWKD